MSAAAADRYALIAGNGQFPLLVLEEARRQGVEMTVVALREEAWPEIEKRGAPVDWLSLGELEKGLGLLREKKINKVVMAGQVKHNQIFSAAAPDSMLKSLLASLPQKNTDSLLGAIAGALGMFGIEVVDSTLFLKALVPEPGPLAPRAPSAEEAADIAYGRQVAAQLARLDLGQTVVVSQRACVAVEAMEGTDSTIERAASLANRRPLVVVKVSKPNQDMRFDVPVVGLGTLEAMKKANATALAIDAGRTLIFDRDEFIRRAGDYQIAVAAFAPGWK